MNAAVPEPPVRRPPGIGGRGQGRGGGVPPGAGTG